MVKGTLIHKTNHVTIVLHAVIVESPYGKIELE